MTSHLKFSKIATDQLTTNQYSPGVYINDFKVKESHFSINGIGITDTTVDIYLLKAQSSSFSLTTGRLYPRLKGTYLQENVEIAIHSSKDNVISEIYIYFSAFSDQMKALALCNYISDLTEEIYGAVINTYFFDTINFSNISDQISIAKINEEYSYTDTYVWLISETKHEVIILCLEYVYKKRTYVPVLKIKNKELTLCSIPSKLDILFHTDLHNNKETTKTDKKDKFLDTYIWNHIEKKSIRLVSPVGKLEKITGSIHRKEDIYEYNKKIQDSYFKVQNDFISGYFYDLSTPSSYSSYAFILLFAILDSYKDKDITKLINQIEILTICCPKIEEYTYFIMRNPSTNSYSHTIYESIDESAKLQLASWKPNLIFLFSIPDYANLILHRKKEDVDLLKNFSDIPIIWLEIPKSYAKRYKISNDILRQDIFEILLIFLRKIGGATSAAIKSISLIYTGKSEPRNKKEERKIQNIHNDIMRYYGCTFYEDIVLNIVNQVKLKNNIIIDTPKEFLWKSFECANFKQYINEAIAEYYFEKEPQKGHIPVPRRKKS